MDALDDEQLHGLRLQAEVEGPSALLRAATSVNAELLGRDDLGRIGPGAIAVVARVRCVPGELVTIATLNTRGIPLTGSQLAERYAVIGAGFDAGEADVVCCQEVFTYWHLRLLVRRMRSFRQVSYRPAPVGPAWRSGHVLPAAGIRHGVPAFRPAAPGSRRSPGVPFPGQAERRPGDPASPPGPMRDQHPSGGQP